MTKKIESTFERFIKSLSPSERKKFDEEYRELIVSEMILAAMAKDNISVKKLAKMAGISPSIIYPEDKEDFNIHGLINKHLGSSFDDLLRKEGTLEAAELTAIKMVIADQIAKEITKKINKKPI